MVNCQIRIGNRNIGDKHPTFVIAEIGINHNGDFDTATQLIREAKCCGADAAKFQTYITEKRVSADSPIFSLLKSCELSFEKQATLKKVCDDLGIIFFSTPFDEESCDFLHSLRVSVYKVASFDVVNLRLIRKIASFGTPVIASRGMTSLAELSKMTSILTQSGSPYCLLHCVSSYPASPESANLNIIGALREHFPVPVGYSDHTIGSEVPILAVAAGARLIEKHFTLDCAMEGPDHKMSANPTMMLGMIKDIRRVESILGSGEIRLLDEEKPTLQYRRQVP